MGSGGIARRDGQMRQRFVHEFREAFLMRFESEDRMDSAIRVQVGCHILEEMNLRR